MEWLIGALVAAVLLIGLVVLRSHLVRRRRAARIAGLEDLAEERSWQVVRPPQQELLNWSAVPYQLLRSRTVRLRLHVAGLHRELRFHAAEVVRPPQPRRQRSESVSVIFVPRPVTGPRLEIVAADAAHSPTQLPQAWAGVPAFDEVMRVRCGNSEFPAVALPQRLALALAAEQRLAGDILRFEAHHLAIVHRGELGPERLAILLDLLADIHGSIPWRTLAGTA